MNYSSHESYLRYGACIARDDLSGAKQALQECIDDMQLNSDSMHHADLLHRMADVLVEMGNNNEALNYYLEAEKLDPDSLLLKLQLARFLADKVGDIDAALVRCELALTFLKANPFSNSDIDFGSDYYLAKAENLMQELISRQHVKGILR